MLMPAYTDAFRVLLLQAADEGRGPLLFGESLARAYEAVPPFLVGRRFPDIYLEHPLMGEPFLDVTVLLDELERGTRIDSGAAGEHATVLDWYADAKPVYPDISCGFELDTKEVSLPVAAIHFQPRSNTELVVPFLEAIGEPGRAALYLDAVARMPKGWPLSFFGLFRGRPDAPLRVCGYLDEAERCACGKDSARLATAFDTTGFTAYDAGMLEQVSTLMANVPGLVDFQFDVFPDGSLSDTFAIDVRFSVERPERVCADFEAGFGARIMGLLEMWGAADGRWRHAIRSAFARALPVELEDGEAGRFAFALMPQWVKVRWSNGVIQPSKLYHLARAGLIDGTGFRMNGEAS